MDSVFTSGQMAETTRARTSKTIDKVRAFSHGPMGEDTKVPGKKAKCMEKELTGTLTELKQRESGLKASGPLY